MRWTLLRLAQATPDAMDSPLAIRQSELVEPVPIRPEQTGLVGALVNR